MVGLADKILVTGGAGFIGSHLVRRLVHLGAQVHLLVRDGTELERISDLLPQLVLHRGDLSDVIALKALVKKTQPAGIFHLATSTIQSGVSAGPEELIRVNIQGTVNLSEALGDAPYSFFVTTGSFLEVGNKNRPLREDDLCEPKEMYSLTKLAATLYGQMIASTKNKPIVTTRIFTPYGPNIQKGRLVYEVVSRALRGEPIHLSAPHVTRDFIFVGDIIELLLEVASKAPQIKGEVFNAGSGVATTLEQLAAYVLKQTSSKSEIVWNPSKLVSYDNGLWQADMEKTSRAFSWRPAHTLQQGIDKTIAWFEGNT